VLTAPFPYWHHFNAVPGADESELVRASLYQVELLLSQQTAPTDTAAIIIEPVLGEGGYVPAPPAFLQGLRSICDKHGLLLIIDEVQSGFGRTGRMFSVEYSGVKPDIMVIAKVQALLLVLLSHGMLIARARVSQTGFHSAASSVGRSCRINLSQGRWYAHNLVT